VAYNPGLVFGSDGTVTFEPAVEGG
jgi:hypothetical protein